MIVVDGIVEIIVKDYKKIIIFLSIFYQGSNIRLNSKGYGGQPFTLLSKPYFLIQQLPKPTFIFLFSVILGLVPK